MIYKLYNCIPILYYDYIIYYGNIADVIKIAPYYTIAVILVITESK